MQLVDHGVRVVQQLVALVGDGFHEGPVASTGSIVLKLCAMVHVDPEGNSLPSVRAHIPQPAM